MNDLAQNAQALEVTETAKKYLKTTSDWTRFFSIMGFIAVGFLGLISIVALLTLLVLSFVDDMPEEAYLFFIGGIIYLILAVAMLFPALYLSRFSQKTNAALLSNNANEIETAFKNLKSYWKFTGVMTIVVIALNIIVMPLLFIAAIMNGV